VIVLINRLVFGCLILVFVPYVFVIEKDCKKALSGLRSLLTAISSIVEVFELRATESPVISFRLSKSPAEKNGLFQ
jgi:hypothetical protein